MYDHEIVIAVRPGVASRFRHEKVEAVWAT